MTTYYVHQEFKDVLWGTPTPILVMINTQPARVRVKGQYSVQVIDAGLLQEKVPDAAALTPQLRITRA